MSELLWTIIAHLSSILNKEYEWSSLTNHRPFVIQLEQGIWVNFFKQSSPIYHPSWTKNMTELFWPIIVHLLSILNKEYEWTSLNNHRPFVIHLEQVMSEIFDQSSSICYPSWTRNMSEIFYQSSSICYPSWTRNVSEIFYQSLSICYPPWTRNMSEHLWTIIAHLLSILNK